MHQIVEFPYSVIFAFLLHQMIFNQTGINKISLDVSFSNRNLPIAQIKELLCNLATGFPVFFDNTDLSAKEFAMKIKEIFSVYFKNMSYGGLSNLWLNEVIKEKIIPYHQRSYYITYTYINKIVREDYIQNDYIDWSRSTSEINPGKTGKKGNFFFRVFNMGPYFVVALNTEMKMGSHAGLVQGLREALLNNQGFT